MKLFSRFVLMRCDAHEGAGIIKIDIYINTSG